MPGALLIGDSAGTLNVPKIKGTHQAMRGGIVAAEHIARTNSVVGFDAALRASPVVGELKKVRNIKPGFHGGLWMGMINAGWETVTAGHSPWTLRNHADYAQLKRVNEIGGVQIVDVRLKRVNLPPEVSESVYRRMETERKRVANELRSTGAAEAEKIRADADRQREVIVAEAYRDAQKIKGDGDAKASAIYAQAFGQNTEFYAFYRSLEAYRASFKNRSDVIVVEPNSDFFKYLKNGSRGR